MEQASGIRRFLAFVLAAAVGAFGSSGCTSVGLSAAQNASGDPATCAIDVRVYDRASDAKAGHPSAGRATSDLETATSEAVHHADGPEWSRSGLAVDVVARKVSTGTVVGITVGVLVVAGIAALVAANDFEKSFMSQERGTQPVPAGAAFSSVPAGDPRVPAEVEELARTVAEAFPE